MIEKEEVVALAKSLSLSPDTVEKDYVLSWLLWGINNDEDLSTGWYFKGGTSLKKCFFETFRFSEDLDFTVETSGHLLADFLRKKFNKIAAEIHDEVGILFFSEQFKFKVLPKENGKYYAQGVIYYSGPLKRKQSAASIKLDLTDHEIVVLKPQRKKVYHPYSDEPQDNIWANCYAFEEVLAEKIRALGERARPRDLYDVVHFFRNRGMIENPQLVYNVLTKKCDYKKIGIPNYASIEKHEKIEELAPQWRHMLAHQLPSLPPLESFWEELEPFFAWLEGHLQEQHLVDFSSADEEAFQPNRVTSALLVDLIIPKIQFAAANRVCIELAYSDKQRTIEPLSFRRSKSGNELFYGYEREESKIKCFSLSKIQSVAITSLPYTEREYPVEISASGIVVMPPIKRKQRA